MQLKPGGRIPEKGKRIALTVKNISDLSRDLIKVCHDCYLNFAGLCAMHRMCFHTS
jgi:hypothetical protein